jgi:hypothetical protein
MHTHDLAHKKILEAVDLHTGDQGLISYVSELVGNIAWCIAIPRRRCRA